MKTTPVSQSSSPAEMMKSSGAKHAPTVESGGFAEALDQARLEAKAISGAGSQPSSAITSTDDVKDQTPESGANGSVVPKADEGLNSADGAKNVVRAVVPAVAMPTPAIKKPDAETSNAKPTVSGGEKSVHLTNSKDSVVPLPDDSAAPVSTPVVPVVSPSPTSLNAVPVMDTKSEPVALTVSPKVKDSSLRPAGQNAGRETNSSVGSAGEASGAGTTPTAVAEKPEAKLVEVTPATSLVPSALVGHVIGSSASVPSERPAKAPALSSTPAQANQPDTQRLSLSRYESSTPNRLEIGVSGGTLGWVSVRAELTGDGTVHALLRGSTETAASLRSHVADMTSFLGTQSVAVTQIAVESTKAVPTPNLQGANGGAGAGSSNGGAGSQEQQRNTPSKVPSSVGADSERQIAILSESLGDAPVTGHALASTGNWLSVRV